MGFTRVRVGNREEGFEYDSTNGYYHEYVTDSFSDIASIPLNGTGRDKPRAGSMCLVTGTKEVYVLSPAGEWKLLIE